MVATVQVVQKNGAGGTQTQVDGGNLRFKVADDANVDLNDPIVIPGSGSNYSYEKWLRFNVTVAPTNQITNLQFYTDGANGMGTGVSMWAKAVTSYATPALITSTSAYTDAFSYTSGSSLNLGAGPYTGTGEIGDHAVLGLEVASTASQGTTPSESLTFSYDET